MSISAYLGYPDDSLEPTWVSGRQILIEAVLVRLKEIDKAIDAGTTDSMAVKVGELSVDYSRHLMILKAEGTRKLKELAVLSGLPVLYDKYSGRSAIAGSSSPFVVQSYW